MYSATINSVSFYGKTRYLSCNSEGKAKTVSDCPFGTAYFGETRGLSEFVRKHSYPAASIEETIGKVHNNQTYRIYVADPKEIVNDLIRQSHDYIVHDIEPAYPDIRTYFETENFNIKKALQIVSDYYKRLESAGITLGDLDVINLSKEKQNIVDKCSEIFNESNDLRDRKIQLENRLLSKSRRIKEIETNSPEYENELKLKQKKLANCETNLVKRENYYKQLKNKQYSLHNSKKSKPEEIQKVNSSIEKYEITISNLTSKIKKYKERIIFLEQYLESAPQRIDNYKIEINNLAEEISKIKRSLMPNFKKLQKFYTVNGIKIIKRA